MASIRNSRQRRPGRASSCKSGFGRREWSRVSISSATTSSKRTGVHVVPRTASRSLRRAGTPPPASPVTGGSLILPFAHPPPGRLNPAARHHPQPPPSAHTYTPHQLLTPPTPPP